MRRLLRFVVVCLAGTSLLVPEGRAQEPGSNVAPLVTDRPDFTESAVTVPKGRVQIESGYTWSRAGDETSHSLGDLLVRWAPLHGFELRLGLNSFVIVERPGADLDGLADVSLGTKLDVVKLFGWPSGVELSLIAGAAIPSGSSETGTRDFQPGGTLAFAVDLSESVSFGSNAGLRFPVESDTRFLQGELSAAVGVGLGESWGTYVEAYALLPEGSRPDELYLNGGVTWLLSRDFQLDARLGSAVAGSTWPNAFAGIGFGWRI